MNTHWIDFLKSNNATISNDLDVQFPTYQQEIANSITAILHLSVIKVTGTDAAQFLQGQLTCNINELTESTSFFSAFCNAKGRVISTLLIIKIADAFLLIMPNKLIDKVIKKLQMYILRSDVNLQNVSEELCLMGLTSHGKHLFQPVPEKDFSAINTTTAIIKFPSTTSRYLIIGPTEHTISLWTQLVQQYNADAINSSAWAYQDVSAGIPWLTKSSSEEFIPQMLNIDDLGGISFNKGCYTGQEIIARTHYLGKAKRKLFLAECAKTAMIDTNIQLISEETEQPFGKVLSIQINEKKLRLLIVLPSSDAELKGLRLNNLCQDKIQIINFQ
jgi:folate-binding protein YgfZ